MAAKAKTKEVTPDELISLYMEYVLENGKEPDSVYQFCIACGIDETVFYEKFGSFKTLQEAIWNKFYENTLQLVEKDSNYPSFSEKEKTLAFFYSFFELLTLNRSYVLFELKSKKGVFENIEQFKGLRKNIKGYISALIFEGDTLKSSKMTDYTFKVFTEGVWLQFLFILKFWKDDNSPSFEKTDIVIEKSVNTAFDIFDHTPLDSIIDLGKFLFKEKWRN